MIELLMMLLILGGLAALAAFGAGAFSDSTPPSLAQSTPTKPTGQSLAGQSAASAISACNTDAEIVETAVAAYEAVNNGATPTIASLLGRTRGGPYLDDFPRSPYFSISIDASGGVLVSLVSADPAGLAPHLYPTDKPPFRAFRVNYDTWTWSEASTTGTAYTGAANICEGA